MIVESRRVKYFMKAFILTSIIFYSDIVQSQNQDNDAFFIKKIYEEALNRQQSYKWLDYLSETIGGRIAG
jgi:hypothetical protein